MRWTLLIIIAVAALIGASIVALPKFALRSAKTSAMKEHADAKAVLNTVPQAVARRIAPSRQRTNTLWLDVADTGSCSLGFPGDIFTRDQNPKRQNAVHHAHYRVWALPGPGGKEFAPVMQELGVTNFYKFVLNVFSATERDIARQPSMDSLQRHTVLLKAKEMLAPVGFEHSCIEFDRGDFRGFIIGDPTRTKNFYIRVYVQSEERFIDLGVIQEEHIQMTDVEELISELKLRSNRKVVGDNY